jgi:hypothetical protein
LLSTYGFENNAVENVELQERLGVDAIIVDHVAHVSKHLLGELQIKSSLKSSNSMM